MKFKYTDFRLSCPNVGRMYRYFPQELNCILFLSFFFFFLDIANDWETRTFACGAFNQLNITLKASKERSVYGDECQEYFAIRWIIL